MTSEKSLFDYPLIEERTLNIVKILLVDDEEELLVATKLYLEKTEKNLQVIPVSSVKSAMNLIKNESFDIIISDYLMPEKNGLEFLTDLREGEYNIPFIIFTGRGREEVVIQALNLGADYYLQKGGDIKSQFSELINLIKKTIERKNAEISIRKSEEKFSKAFQFSFNSIWISRLRDGVIIDVNNNFTKMLNYPRHEVINNTYLDKSIWAKQEDYLIFKNQIMKTNEIIDFETILLAENSRLIPVMISATLIDIEGEMCILSVARDISELTQALEALKENESKYRMLFEESPIALFNLNLFDVKIEVNELKKMGINNIVEHIKNDVNLAINFLNLIKLNEINKAALEIIGVETIDLSENIFNHNFAIRNIDLFLKIFSFLLNGDQVYEGEFTIDNLLNKQYQIIMRLSYAPGTQETWANIYISMLDITKRIHAQETLRKERKAFSIITAAAINSQTALELCDKILTGLIDTLGFDLGTIRLIDLNKNEYVPVAIKGVNQDKRNLIKSISPDDNSNKLLQSLEDRKIIFISDTSESDLVKDSEIISQLKIKTYIFCPIVNPKNEILGSIQLGSFNKKEILEEEKFFFEIVAEMFSSILNRMLYH
ncbi:MAG: response regulator [Candidatus Heimdallarchaeota archaeon]|nr:response regulator [Candidatus Heimdallarchaeota archaeon]